MDTIASYAIVGFLLTGLVQYLKSRVPAHALLILAALSFVCASAYAILVQTGYWETVMTVGIGLAATANLLFNLFRAAYEALGGDDSEVQPDA